ncbi:MAG TPA: prepilin-type N-terminal cleavage/methylation domain-containing protein [Candidatus Angelobacter sp.]|nr:prepilin-type N-terminal cleavage/methylation domain-containing protein [Candidatus Angelobacter sp.]
MKTCGRTTRRGGNARSQRGFSIIEVLVAGVILTIGLVGVLSLFSLAMANAQTSQQDMIAKQLANAAMESIFTARDTAQLQWDQIQNTGAGTTPDGIFAVGPQQILLTNTTTCAAAGTCGILGTAQTGGAQTLVTPGPDGILGTADDVTVSLANYRRTIAIAPFPPTDPNATVRQITITVTYTAAQLRGQPRSYVMTGFISQFR